MPFDAVMGGASGQTVALIGTGRCGAATCGKAAAAAAAGEKKEVDGEGEVATQKSGTIAADEGVVRVDKSASHSVKSAPVATFVLLNREVGPKKGKDRREPPDE